MLRFYLTRVGIIRFPFNILGTMNLCCSFVVAQTSALRCSLPPRVAPLAIAEDMVSRVSPQTIDYSVRPQAYKLNIVFSL